MTQVWMLVLWSVVIAQCAAYLLGLYRGRPGTRALREGAVCIAFAVYTIAHAVNASYGAPGVRGLAGTVHGLAAILLVPAWVALAAGLHRPLRSRLRFASGYAMLGFAGATLAALGLDSDRLHVPFVTRPGIPERSFDEVLASGYLFGGLLFVAITLASVVQKTKFAPATRTVTAALGLAVAAGLHDLYSLVLAPEPRPVLLDHALGLVALACLDNAIRQIAIRGDDLYAKTAELAQSYADLRSTQERLVRNEQLAAVGELSAVIAHEVRNPLAIIKNALSGLRRKTLQISDRGMLLDIVDEETDKLNRLMHDLLAYARPVAPRLGEVDLDELLHRSVARACGGVTGPVGLDVRIDTSQTIDALEGDTELLVHAFVNIIENALQAMPNGGTLDIRTRYAVANGRASIAIDVSDTGEGMDTLVRQKARDPFFTTRPTGTGLGLAIVERVVRNHGGHIEISSNHGEGTTVSILLPLDRQSLTPLPPHESSSLGVVLPGSATP